MEQDVISAVYSFTPDLQAVVGAILHLSVVKQHSATPIGRRLSLIHAGSGKDMCNGTKLTSAVSE